jgi:hypothetical protein
MSVFVGAPGSIPSNDFGVTGAFELNTMVYVREPPESTGSALIIGRLFSISILTLLKGTGVGVGLAVGEGLAVGDGLGDGLGLGLGLGVGVGDGVGVGFKTLRVSVSWKILRCA